MPREEKKIFFNYSETYNAIFSLCNKKGLDKPPTGTLTSITHDEGADLYKLLFVDPIDNSQKKAEYKSDFMAAALLLYCMGQGIPVSKRARKSVFLEGEETVLFAEQ